MSPTTVSRDHHGGPEAPAATTPTPGTGRSWAAGVVIRAIRGYQLARSGRPTGCRYLPSCSEYAIEAVGRHGALRGSVLAARRLARCTPWGGHGIDPVPDRRTPCTHP
jgi:putative membrane protein insertion efficiency factor